MYKNLDQTSMFDSIWQFPDDLKKAEDLGNNIKLSNQYSNIYNIVIAGMGGSAIGGDVVSILENDNFIGQIICAKVVLSPEYLDKVKSSDLKKDCATKMQRYMVPTKIKIIPIAINILDISIQYFSCQLQ